MGDINVNRLINRDYILRQRHNADTWEFFVGNGLDRSAES